MTFWSTHKNKILLLIILLLAVGTRAIPLIRGPFLNPYTMLETLVMQQTIANHGARAINSFSGFGVHSSGYIEMNLIYLATIPYILTGGLFGLFNTLYLIDSLFIIATGVAIFLFIRKMTSNTSAGLFGAVLYAFSQIGIYWEAFNNWDGLSFVPNFLIMAILIFFYAIDEKEKYKKILLYLLSAVPIIFGYILWNGGGYALAAYLFVIFLLIANQYLKNTKKTLLIVCVLVTALWLIALNTSLLSTLEFATKINSQQVATQYAAPNIKTYIEEGIFQFDFQDYQTSVLYSAFLSGGALQKIPFLAWAAVSFLSSTFLALLYLIRFREEDAAKRRMYLSLLVLLIFSVPFALEGWYPFIYLPIIILGGSLLSTFSAHERKLFIILMVAVILPLTFFFTYFQIYSSPVYEGINPQMHQAALWLRNNTPSNSTVLAFVGDGDAIEYWGHRQSFTDTNLADNQSEIDSYYSFLYARAGNFSYLLETRPDYLFLHDIPYNGSNSPAFNGSNIQYLIEWALNPNPTFSYEGINFSLVYANFSLTSQENRTLIYGLSYNGN